MRRPSEKQLQNAVIEEARLRGWRVAHFRPARVMRGGKEIYETPVAADGKGFPDLVLVRPPRLMFVEMKSHIGKASPEQLTWLSDLSKCAVVVNGDYPPEEALVEVYVWRPNDWESGVISRRLK